MFSSTRFPNLSIRLLHFSKAKVSAIFYNSDTLSTGPLVAKASGSMMLRPWISLCAVGSELTACILLNKVRRLPDQATDELNIEGSSNGSEAQANGCLH